MKVLLSILLCSFITASLSLSLRAVDVKNLERYVDRSTEGPEDYLNGKIFSLILKDNDCSGCTTFVNTVRTVIDLGLEYEDLEGVALQICEVLLGFVGYKGEIICPGVVPNYGPHIFTIFGTTQNTSAEVCEVLEYCDPVVQSDTQLIQGKQWVKQNSGNNVKQEEKPASVPFQGLKAEPVKNMAEKARKQIQDIKEKKRERRQVEGLRIAHLTDVHVEFEYVLGSASDCGLHMCCRNETDGTGSAGEFGSFTCNIPPTTVQMFLEYIAELQPDVLLYTGDTPSNAVWAETVERQINGTIWLAQQISQILPDVPAYFTIGNHETFPTNLYYTPRPEDQMLHQAFIDFWGPLAGFGEEQAETVRDGGYYTVLLRPGLRVLSWNSNFGAKSNWYNILNHYKPEYYRMQEFVRNTLQTARDSGEKVIVLSHHPVGGGLRYYTEWETGLVVEFGDVILLHTQGHNHGDEFNVFVDPETLEPRTYQLSAPSLSTSPEKNPSCRLFHLDPETFELLDYQQYFLYLGNEDGLVDDPEIVLWYSVKEDYGHANLTAAGWLDFVYRMSEDTELFNRYLLNRDTMYYSSVTCTGECVTDFLCSKIDTVEGASIDCPLRN